MNSKNAHLYLPFVVALTEGKVVEFNAYSDVWENHQDYVFSDAPESYRIAKPKTVVKSRRYIWKADQNYRVYTVNTEEELQFIYTHATNVKWIDEDWVYTEV